MKRVGQMACFGIETGTSGQPAGKAGFYGPDATKPIEVTRVARAVPLGQARELSNGMTPHNMTESRERLIAAATELFFGGGFHNVGIAEICDVGRVNKGTFYHFFPSKLDLLLEVIDNYVNDIAAKYREIAQDNDSPARKLRSVFMVPQKQNEAWKSVHGTSSGCFLGNVILELALTEPVVRDKARWALDQWSLALQPVVEEFLKAENIKNLDAPAAAEVLIGIMQGAHVMAKARNDSGVFANYGQLAVELIRAAGNPK